MSPSAPSQYRLSRAAERRLGTLRERDAIRAWRALDDLLLHVQAGGLQTRFVGLKTCEVLSKNSFQFEKYGIHVVYGIAEETLIIASIEPDFTFPDRPRKLLGVQSIFGASLLDRILMVVSSLRIEVKIQAVDPDILVDGNSRNVVIRAQFNCPDTMAFDALRRRFLMVYCARIDDLLLRKAVVSCSVSCSTYGDVASRDVNPSVSGPLATAESLDVSLRVWAVDVARAGIFVSGSYIYNCARLPDDVGLSVAFTGDGYEHDRFSDVRCRDRVADDVELSVAFTGDGYEHDRFSEVRCRDRPGGVFAGGGQRNVRDHAGWLSYGVPSDASNYVSSEVSLTSWACASTRPSSAVGMEGLLGR